MKPFRGVDTMKNFVERMERYIIRLVVTGLVLMITVQAVMTQDQYRMYLSWGERLEGESLKYPVNVAHHDEQLSPEAVSPDAVIVLSINKYSSLPQAVVMVNGEEKTTFNAREIRLKLKAGDVLEIDTTHYNFPIEFKVTELSNNVAFPRKGQTWTGHQGLTMLGKIIVK